MSNDGAPEVVHCQFRLTSVAKVEDYQAGVATQVKFYPSQGEPFGHATPSGNIEMYIRNAEAAKLFDQPGILYDVFFSKVKPKEEGEGGQS